MAAQFHRPNGLKYTDMCIYIDANMHKVKQNGEYPEIESKIYEYLYHILYALAFKKSLFKNFSDYDAFAIFGASELFLSLRKKEINDGKVIRGKEVVRTKSCLNYIKSVLYPLKVNYTRKNFAEVFNPEIDQDTSIIGENLRESIRSQYRNNIENDLWEVLNHLDKHIKKVLKETPYKKDKLMMQRLYRSCQLTFLNDITLPTPPLRNKKLSKTKKENKTPPNKIINIYKNNVSNVILWHLPEHMRNYIRLLVTKIKHIITDDIEETRAYTELSDEVVDNIMKTAYSTYDDQWGD